jgi:hypothetical protein
VRQGLGYTLQPRPCAGVLCARTRTRAREGGGPKGIGAPLTERRPIKSTLLITDFRAGLGGVWQVSESTHKRAHKWR